MRPTGSAFLRRGMRWSAVSQYVLPPTNPSIAPLPPPDLLSGFNKHLQPEAQAAQEYRLYAQCNHNNAIFTLTNPTGSVIAWTSGGHCGFKGAQKASYEAGYQCSVRIFQKISELLDAHGKYITVHILLNGRGRAREALQKALTSTEGEEVRPYIKRLTDRTPIKVGGTRAQKARRL